MPVLSRLVEATNGSPEDATMQSQVIGESPDILVESNGAGGSPEASAVQPLALSSRSGNIWAQSQLEQATPLSDPENATDGFPEPATMQPLVMDGPRAGAWAGDLSAIILMQPQLTPGPADNLSGTSWVLSQLAQATPHIPIWSPYWEHPDEFWAAAARLLSLIRGSSGLGHWASESDAFWAMLDAGLIWGELGDTLREIPEEDVYYHNVYQTLYFRLSNRYAIPFSFWGEFYDDYCEALLPSRRRRPRHPFPR